MNTLHVGRDGVLRGYNTDARGFVDHLRAATNNANLIGRKVLLLGAGGAARAIIDGLQQADFEDISVANRTDERALELVTTFGVKAVPWAQMPQAARTAELLINTTAGGMVGKPVLEFEADWLNPTAIVCDIVYTPRRTPLLEMAAARGCVTVEGLGMLIQQARRSFQIWTGLLPEPDVALEKLLREKLGS